MGDSFSISTPGAICLFVATLSIAYGMFPIFASDDDEVSKRRRALANLLTSLSLVALLVDDSFVQVAPEQLPRGVAVLLGFLAGSYLSDAFRVYGKITLFGPKTPGDNS